MASQVFPGAWRGVFRAVDGAQPVFLLVGAELPVEGIEYPVTNAYQPAGRIVHLWHHQLEDVPNAVDTSSGEQFGHLLELRGNLPAQLPVW